MSTSINGMIILVPLAIIVILIIICFIITMINSSKISTLMDYSDDGDIIGALKEYYNKIDDLAKTVNKNSDAVLQSRLADCESQTSASFKKLGIIHFDAFDDVKGNMSFSMALLNNNDDGVIFTSLYGHNSCNTYIREIKNGKSSIKLLDEELKALDRAKNKLKKGNNNGREKEE